MGYFMLKFDLFVNVNCNHKYIFNIARHFLYPHFYLSVFIYMNGIKCSDQMIMIIIIIKKNALYGRRQSIRKI